MSIFVTSPWRVQTSTFALVLVGENKRWVSEIYAVGVRKLMINGFDLRIRGNISAKVKSFVGEEGQRENTEVHIAR